MDQRVSLRLGLVALFGALALAGCGRKGPLTLPANAPPSPQTQSSDASLASRVLPLSDNPGLIQPPNRVAAQPAGSPAAQPPSKPINAPPAAPSKSFILDPLL